MDTMNKFGLSKRNAWLLFLQMILTIIMLGVSIYLLVFSLSNKLGGYMITSYIFITLSMLAIIFYGTYGYKKEWLYYLLSVVPFLGAILVNIILPGREAFQIALLAVLFALTFAFLIKQEDTKFTRIISISMVVVSLVFSIYSSIKANVTFLGDISTNWVTYLSMYLSIFIPTITSGTFALTYEVRSKR